MVWGSRKVSKEVVVKPALHPLQEAVSQRLTASLRPDCLAACESTLSV